MTRYIFDEDKKVFVPGKAKPKLLEPELRKLPSELVTTEIEQPDKIHELDPPHIRESLKEEFEEKGKPKKASLEERLEDAQKDPFFEEIQKFVMPGMDAHLGDVRLTQERVDWIRFGTLNQKLKTARDNIKMGFNFKEQFNWLRKIQHLWFPYDDCRIGEVREGAPPPRLKRPGYLKQLDLVCDIECWPKSIVSLLWKRGITLPEFKDIEGDLEHESNMFELFEGDGDADEVSFQEAIK